MKGLSVCLYLFLCLFVSSFFLSFFFFLSFTLLCGLTLLHCFYGCKLSLLHTKQAYNYVHTSILKSLNLNELGLESYHTFRLASTSK